MTKLLGITFLTSTLLALAPTNLLADNSQCSTWQNNPSSVNPSSLESVTKNDIEQCMNSCKNIPLSSSNTDLSPALCMQHVSNIAYLAEAGNNIPNATSSNTPPTQEVEKSNTPQPVTHTNLAQPQPTNTKATPSSTSPTEKPKTNSNIIHWI